MTQPPQPTVPGPPKLYQVYRAQWHLTLQTTIQLHPGVQLQLTNSSNRLRLGQAEVHLQASLLQPPPLEAFEQHAKTGQLRTQPVQSLLVITGENDKNYLAE